MFSVLYLRAMSALLVVTITDQACTDNPFCNVAKNGNEMKTLVATLARDKDTISQLTNDVASFKSRLDILEVKC